jgi:hypothetical protein
MLIFKKRNVIGGSFFLAADTLITNPHPRPKRERVEVFSPPTPSLADCQARPKRECAIGGMFFFCLVPAG